MKIGNWKLKIGKKLISWVLALAIVFPSFFVAFSPVVFARIQEAVNDLGGVFGEESSKYAFVGIDAETGGSEVFFFDGNNNVRITNNGVTDGNAQYDEFSNKIVYQSLLEGQWQIFLYDTTTNTTAQLSYEGNNTDPKISNGQVVWQSWVDDNWEIYFYDSTASQRLSFNEGPDVEPKLSNGYVAWREYQENQSGESKKGIDSKNYNVAMFDSFKKEFKKLTQDFRADDSLEIEFPYVVWQTDDGNDTEIMIHNISDGTTSLLTNNSHDDRAPKIKKGKLKWFEDIIGSEEPSNIVDKGLTSKRLLPSPLPPWWEDPLECPQKENVCGYVNGEISAYANACYVEKAGGEVLHPGTCTGDEEWPIISPIATTSETFSPSLVVSPSLPFEPTASLSAELSPSPQPEEGIFSQPGTFENTGSFDEEGSLIIEERVPANLEFGIWNLESGITSGSLPVVNDAKEPVIFEESALMKAGETISNVVVNTASQAAQILDAVIPGDQSGSFQEEKTPQPAEIIIQPTPEAQEVIPTPEVLIPVSETPVE